MPPESINNTINLIKQLFGTYSWALLAMFIAMFFKDFIHNIIASFVIFFGSDINEDDIVYINGRKGRVTRIGFRKTIFYMSDNHTKMIVPNERLKTLTIEKKLYNGKLDNDKPENI